MGGGVVEEVVVFGGGGFRVTDAVAVWLELATLVAVMVTVWALKIVAGAV